MPAVPGPQRTEIAQARDLLLAQGAPLQWRKKAPIESRGRQERRLAGRQRLLRRLSVSLCAAWQFGKPTIEFGAFENPDQLGASTVQPKSIVKLAAVLLGDASPTRALSTLVHEHRHLKQLDDLANCAHVATDDLPAELRKWRHARVTYPADQLAGGIAYYLNALEVDARDAQWRVLAAYWEAL